MTALPRTIGRRQSLASAQEEMRQSGLRHLPVLDGGLLAGVLSQRDAYLVETIAGVDPEKVSVEEAMSVDVSSVAPDTPLLDVAAEMADHKYGCAIVTQGTDMIGIFTVVDALRALVAITASSGTKHHEALTQTRRLRRLEWSPPPKTLGGRCSPLGRLCR